jgi:CRISPR/Cas system-associated exonuclease Cas4 (RecB family)
MVRSAINWWLLMTTKVCHFMIRYYVACGRSVILERCLKRLEWDKARAREAQELEDELERERVAMQQVMQ